VRDRSAQQLALLAAVVFLVAAALAVGLYLSARL